MFKSLLQISKNKKSSAFFLIVFSSAIICYLIRPCYGSSDLAVANDAAHTKSGVQADNFSESMTDYAYSRLKIYDDIVRAGLLYDLLSETVVWEKNMHESYPIASLTKMMVGLLVVEDINAGKIAWNTMVRVTPEATRTGGYTVSLKVGCLLSIEDILKAAMISSGNDAAYLLAQSLGSTEKKFVNRMNSRAKQLGMASTAFSNATGMPAPNRIHDNRSSPSDLLILCKEMLKHDKLMRIAGMGESSILQENKIIQLKNHNRLVAAFDEVDGLKTGYTRNAKFCLAATASKKYHRIIGIALGVDSSDLRNQFVGNLLSQYYDVLGFGSLQPKPGFPASYAQGTSLTNFKASAVYQVRKGDTLYGIAKKYDCSVAQLKDWNRIKKNMIFTGQRLTVYGKSDSLHSAVARNFSSPVVYYTVKPGDTLWRISQKYNGVSVKKLMQSNGIKQPSELKAGDTIKIVLEVGSSSA
ncbi:MAG: LysM peptidoglycan-binding domain-containing protein [Desulfobacterales bacterium]